MKLFNGQMVLRFGKRNWTRDPELVVIDTILEQRRELYKIVMPDLKWLSKDSVMGRKDIPTVEQIVRAALYKEIKEMNYRDLEYAEEDSRICGEFLKLNGREPFSYQVLQKYISKISSKTLKKLMIEINKIAIENGLEDGKRITTDSTVIETDIHHPTDNALVWDSIKKLNRLFRQINKAIPKLKLRDTTKQAKKNYFKINVTKKEKREGLFVLQLKILERDIKRARKTVWLLGIENADYAEPGIRDFSWLMAKELRNTIEVVEKVYEAAFRREILVESVPSSEKIFSIHEKHTDIIVKGNRAVKFGHKVNFAIGKSNLILDCFIPDGNPKDTDLYQDTLKNISENYKIKIQDGVTDGGYASKANGEFAKKMGLINIVFNKVVGSLKNTTVSRHIETKLKKWRSTIEAVISNIKRGFDLRRCAWKGRMHFDAKVFWSVIAYNIRVMASLLLKKFSLA